ncbi:MAG: carboxymethylenebutenolidase [Psychromonas sp.]|jgi:carboxymethylenebutenolidase
MMRRPLMIQLAELDKSVNANWPEYKQDLEVPTIDYVIDIYPQMNHGFHNDFTPCYDPKNAELAWQHSIDFF